MNFKLQIIYFVITEFRYKKDTFSGTHRNYRWNVYSSKSFVRFFVVH